MKKKSLVLLLVAIIATMMIFTVSACDSRKGDWPETGTYYFDAEDGSEYTVTFEKGKKFSYVTDSTKTGKYKVDDGTDVITITMTVSKKETITAIYRHSERSVTIDQNKYLEKIDYTITFDMGDGDAIPSAKLRNGRIFLKPQTPSRAGYLFAGWYTSSNYRTEYVFGMPIAGDLTIYGRWVSDIKTPPEFMVSFDLNYQTDDYISPMETTGHKIYNLATPQREGYTFKGWWVSQYQDSKFLSYPFDKETELLENITLYAYWVSNEDISPKLSAPIIRIVGDEIRWDAVTTATYNIEVKGPNGILSEYTRTNLTAGFLAVKFSTLPAGDYIISVQAMAANPINDSETSIIYYRNKALPRVSFFEVDDDESIFKFNSVGATSYLVYIICADDLHLSSHYPKVVLDNERALDFSGCFMPENEGIIFRIIAHKDGFADSFAEFEYARVLPKVDMASISVDSANQLSWGAVKNATSYIIDIICGDETHRHSHQNRNIGNKTSYSLSECSPLTDRIKITVTPVSKSWQSPRLTEEDIFKFNKTILASPRNIELIGEAKLTWSSVPGADLYEIEINGEIIDTVEINEFEVEPNMLIEGVNTVRIRATKDAAASDYNQTKSLFSKEFYLSTEISRLIYQEGYLSWAATMYAEQFEVQVNDEPAFEVADFFTEITLTKSENIIKVRAISGGTASEWVSITVPAFTVTYDINGEEYYEYKADGDKITFIPNIVGYNFTGWWSSLDANGFRYDLDEFRVSKNVTLYARYDTGNYYASLNYGDGMGPNAALGRIDTLAVSYGDQFKLPKLIVKYDANGRIIDDGLSFIGWYTADGRRLSNELGESLNGWDIADNITLYARWTKILIYTALPSPSGNMEYAVSRPPFASPEIGWFNLVSNLYIPSTYDGKKVALINAWAFDNCAALTTVQIPNAVRSISASAFTRCSRLKEINLYVVPNNYDIIFEVIDGALLKITELDDITGKASAYDLIAYPAARVGHFSIPEGVSTIYASTFRGNKNISGITIPKTVNHIDDYSFENCISLKTVIFDKNLESPIKTIGTNMFANCSDLQSVILPAELETIGSNAFSYSGLKSVTIPKTVTSIQAGAFYACKNLETLEFEKGGKKPLVIGFKLVEYTSGELADLEDSEVQVLAHSDIMTSAFNNCVSLKSVEIPARTYILGNFTFAGCTDLSSLTFESIDTVDKDSYVSKELRIGTSTRTGTAPNFNYSTNTSVFRGTSIQNIVFPRNITFIGSKAFIDIAALDSVSFEKATENNGLSIVSDAFINSGIRSFTVPLSVNSTSSVSGDTSNKGMYNGNAKISLALKLSDSADGLFYGCKRFANLYLEAGHKGFNVVDNGVYSADNKEILYVPIAANGAYILQNGITTIGARIFENRFNITALSIPDTVTTIGSYAFSGMTITSLNLPKNANFKTIGDNTFRNMGELLSINIPSSVTSIGNNAFLGCNMLASITLSQSLVSIGSSAFENTALIFLTIPNTVISIGESAFKGTTGLSTLEFAAPQSGYGQNLNIGRFAFQNTGIESVEIPARITSLKDVFRDCLLLRLVTFESGNNDADLNITNAFTNTPKLENIELPLRLKTIGSEAFMNSGIESIVIKKNVSTIFSDAFIGANRILDIEVASENESFISVEGVLFTKNSQTQAHESLIVYAGGNQSYTIASGTKSINENAFNGRSLLIYLTVANSVETIRSYSIANVPNLRVVDFAAGGTNDLVINTYAFQNSLKVESVSFPSRLVSIGENAFAGLKNLAAVSFVNDQTSRLVEIKSEAFRNTGIVELILPDSLSTIGDSAFRDTIMLANVTLPQNNIQFTALSANVFRSSGVSNIVIPNTVKSIGISAFQGTKNLSGINAITFEEGNTFNSIGESAFEGSGITHIILPDSTKTIMRAAFSKSALTEIDIPDAVTTLGTNVFEDATALVSVSLPNASTFTVLSNSLFKGTTSLQNVILTNYIKTIGESAFENSGIANILITNSVTAINTNAFAGTSLTSIELPNTVTTILSGAFMNTALLSEVVLPQNATYKTIQPSTFENTPRLATISIPYTITQLGDSAFKNSGLGGIDGIADGVVFELNASNKTGILLIGANAFNGSNLKKIVIPDTVTSLGKAAFQNTRSLLEITLSTHTNFKVLPENVFNGSAISSIFIPRNITTIDANAFENTFNLGGEGKLVFETRTIAGMVTAYLTDIGKEAFKGSAITHLEIPDSVLRIGEGAFESSALTKTKLPSNTTYKIIAARTFKNSALMGEIVIPQPITTITGGLDTGAFSLIATPFNISFPVGTTALTVESYAFKNSNLTGSLTLPSRMSTIAAYAFINTNITGLVIEDGTGALNIGENAFSVANTLNQAPASYITGLSGDVVLPGRLNAVGENAFYGARLSSIKIKSGFRGSLAKGSFGNIKTPFTFTIEDGGMITSWSDQVFAGSSGLTFFKAALSPDIDFLKNSVDTSGSNGTFYEISQANKQGSVRPYSISSEDGVVYGFYNDADNPDPTKRNTVVKTIKIANVQGEYTVPEDVIRIGGNSFTEQFYGYMVFGGFRNSGGLTKIIIHKNVNYIADTAFKGCYNLLEFEVDPDNEFFENDEEGVLYNKGGGMLMAFPGGKTGSYKIREGTAVVRAFAFGNGPETQNEKTPEDLISIKIEEIIIPSSVTTLGSDPENQYQNYSPDVFKNAKNLKRVIFEPGGGLSKISPKTFSESGVEEVLGIPASVLTIGSKTGMYLSDRLAFQDCLNLKTITFESGSMLEYISPFVNCPSLENITLPDSLTSIPEGLFEGTNIRLISIHNGITQIPKNAFKDTRNLEEIELPFTLRDEFDPVNGRLIKRAIGVGAFQNSGIKRIEIPQGVQALEEDTFNGCDRLESIIMPDGLQALGSRAFKGTTSLKQIKLPNITGITNPLTGERIQAPLGEEVFGASGLISITLPFGLSEIPSATFRNSADLEYLYIPASVTTITSNSFTGCGKLTVYTDLLPSQWNTVLLSIPIVFNITTLYDNNAAYVHAISTSKGLIINSENGVNAPQRSGYIFLGWSITRSDPVVSFTMDTLKDAPESIVLYAVWKAA